MLSGAGKIIYWSRASRQSEALHADLPEQERLQGATMTYWLMTTDLHTDARDIFPFFFFFLCRRTREVLAAVRQAGPLTQGQVRIHADDTISISFHSRRSCERLPSRQPWRFGPGTHRHSLWSRPVHWRVSLLNRQKSLVAAVAQTSCSVIRRTEPNS